MRSRTILLFYTFVIAILFGISLLFPDEGIDIGNSQLRFTSIEKLIWERKPAQTKAIDTATMRAMQLQDSVDYYRSLVDSGDLRFWLPEPHYLDNFWQTVEQAHEQGRTVRVLHYGDSQIELDHITCRLRSYMQENFGGGGPGMLPFQTITPTFSVRQSNNGELTYLASFGDSMAVRSRGDYGPMMQSFRLRGEATASIRNSSNSHVDDRLKRFSQVRLIYNNQGGLNISFTDIKSKKDNRHTASANHGVSSTSFTLDSATSAFRLTVNGEADLYCMLVDDGSGVAVDNIPMRGCSGQQFTHVGEKMLRAAYNQMDIGMIILQFGGNSVPYIKDNAAISTYCKAIGRQIDHIHQCCPEAKIVFVGPSDMSHRYRGEMQTYQMLPALIDSLAATATAHGAAYWSIYHAMGGHNSMVEWSRQGLAGKDYIHFSQKGADLMGDNMAKAFENSHELYRLEQNLKKQKQKSNEEKQRGGRR